MKQSLKDYAPLLFAFALIAIFTVWRQIITESWNWFEVMPDFMGAFFVVFSAFKLLNWKGFAEAYAMYDILALRSRVYAFFYPLLELGLGISYLVRYELDVVNWVTLALMVVGSVGVAKKLMKKEQIQCACLGVVFKLPMTYVTLAEDLLMAIMALIMILA